MAVTGSTATRLRPQVRLAGCAEYVGETPTGRISCGQKQIKPAETDHNPGADFCRGFIEALLRCPGDQPRSLALRCCADDHRIPNPRKHCPELRRHWLAMRRLHLPLMPVGRRHWEVDDLTVQLSPELGLLGPDGQCVVIKLWLKQEALTKDGIQAVHWLLARHMPQLRPGGARVVLDLHRQRWRLPTRQLDRPGLKETVTADARDMGVLWRRVAGPDVSL